MAKIQVFIATYNRHELILEIINSVLNQSFDFFEVIISDNSTNNETEKLLKNFEDNRLIYRKRKHSLPAIDHFNVILDEVTAEYFMIFHDDDIMFPEMLKTLHSKITKNDSAVAIGSNAKVSVRDVIQKKNYNPYIKLDELITSRDEMIARYLIYNIMPFPSYLYKKVVAEKLRFDIKLGGKYCDAAFIISLLSIGHIVFSALPMMTYFIHSGQDSSTNDFNQKVKLINYYIRTSSYSKKHPLIIRFRLENIFGEIKNKININQFPLFYKRNQKMMLFFLKNSTFKYFPRLIFEIIKKNIKVHNQ